MSESAQISVYDLALEAARDVRLDNLDQVLLLHTQLFEEITRDLPELRYKAATAKAAMEEVRAIIDDDIRTEADEAKKKTTESSVASMILLDPKYQLAQTAYLAARRDQDAVERARDVMIQREAAIKGLITLFQAQYWSLHGIANIPTKAMEPGQRGFKRRDRQEG